MTTDRETVAAVIETAMRFILRKTDAEDVIVLAIQRGNVGAAVGSSLPVEQIPRPLIKSLRALGSAPDLLHYILEDLTLEEAESILSELVKIKDD